MLKQEAFPDRERPFICPCAKSYFSYAALFTHIKQKHDGKPPGAIIKPKSENKRGRPRKNPTAQSHTSDSRQTQKQSEKGSAGVGQLNSTVQLGKPRFDLKSTPGSQFKIYKKDNSSAPTSNQLPQKENFQFELLRDLSRYLEIRTLNEVPVQFFQSLPAKKYLESEGESQSSVVQNFKSFLCLCKNGLRSQTHSQIFLLLSMLLQHILESDQCPQTQSNSHLINDHIVSFFDYVRKYSQLIDLSPFDIFNDLNTIKTLIVFSNWLTIVEREIVSEEERSLCSD